MVDVPEYPKLYHITHLKNLSSIIQDRQLLSDAAIDARGGTIATIGMNNIKQRRMELPIKCYQDIMVADAVPFYFCPRSIMLYIIHCANHPRLTYRGGQEDIIHFEVDLYRVISWAKEAGQHWAFSLSNAGAYYTEFRNNIDQLIDIDWESVVATDFSDSEVKEGKQAEFLLQEKLPWHLVDRIGVYSESLWKKVSQFMIGAYHKPTVEVIQKWYY